MTSVQPPEAHPAPRPLLRLFDLSGRSAVVTGGHGDLADSIAGALAELGCAVALAARRVEACEALAHRLEAEHGVRTLPLAADVSRADDIQRLMSSALAEFGAIDVLVNSAATFWSAPAEDVPLERGWQRVLDTNLTGTFLSCQAAGRAMLAAGRGSIINVAATGGMKSFLPEMGPNLSYMTSKAAVIKLTRDLGAQWARRGVRVNAIAPGSIAGGMMQSLPEQKLAPMVAQIPMDRQGRPDELRGAVAYLASDASSYVTGTVLVVDGGQSIV
jgi:NAD(P)-dependent dehydrogenase (short-subunit alcohol dehydrogenase family)